MISLKLTPWIVAGCCISLTGFCAAPSISSITYENDINNSTIIIKGSGFGEGPNVIAFENFEDVPDKENTQKITDSNPNKDNTSHRPNRGFNSSSNVKDVVQLPIEFGDIYYDVFISFSVLIPPGTTFAGSSQERQFPNVSSWKLTWLMLGKNGFENSNFDICIPSHVGNGNFVIGGNDGTLTWLKNGKDWWDWENFNHFSSYISFDRKDLSRQEIEYQFSVNNAVTYYDTSGKLPASKLTSQHYGFDRILFPGWWGNGDNRKFNALYDNIYVAAGKNSLARIVLSNKKSIAESDIVVTIPAIKWTGEEIVLKQSNIPRDQHYYLHIYNSSGSKSADNEQKTVCPGCPKIITPTT